MTTECKYSTVESRKKTKILDVRDVIGTDADGADYLIKQIMTLYYKDQKSVIITRIIDHVTGKTEAVDLDFV